MVALDCIHVLVMMLSGTAIKYRWLMEYSGSVVQCSTGDQERARHCLHYPALMSIVVYSNFIVRIL